MKSMRLLFALFLLIFTALVVVATQARATVIDPTRQVTLQEDNSVAMVTPQALNEGGYYHTLLDLQRQLFLLRKLVEREKRNFDLTSDYQKIGLNFQPTAPSAQLCRQVPANLSCAEFYTQMYPNFPPVGGNTVGALPDTPILASSVGTINENEFAFLPTISDVADTRDILNWLDITCLETKCSAVVTPDIADKSARYKVYVGDQLPNGDKIMSISAKGVMVSNAKGQKRRIDPAPKPSALQALK